MEITSARILESKYFSPAFNTAIFDGPVRLYFSQHQESDALKVYFRLQNHFKTEAQTIPGTNMTFQKEASGKTIFIMIYPNKESFLQSFDLDKDLAVESFDNDVVIGIQSPISEPVQDKVLNNIEFILGDRDFS